MMKRRMSRPMLAGVPGADKFNQWIDRVMSSIEASLSVSTDGILSKTFTPTGIHLHVPPFPIAIVKTTSTIGARSGVNPGIGTVTFQLFNQTSFVDDTALSNITVYNYSSNSTLTPSGKYGVAIKWFGVWWLVIVEC